jgi:hypothetical protein
MANRSWILDAPYRQLGDRVVGAGRPVYITGEIGINHNGDLDNADAANPREINKNGHVIEITERNNRAGTTSFSWDLFLVCGDADQAGTYFGGWKGPVAPISFPDNLAFDSAGNLWIRHRWGAWFHIQGRRVVPGATRGRRARSPRAIPRRAVPGRNLRPGDS